MQNPTELVLPEIPADDPGIMAAGEGVLQMSMAVPVWSLWLNVGSTAIVVALAGAYVLRARSLNAACLLAAVVLMVVGEAVSMLPMLFPLSQFAMELTATCFPALNYAQVLGQLFLAVYLWRLVTGKESRHRSDRVP